MEQPPSPANMPTHWRSVREMHLIGMKSIRTEIDGNQFMQFNEADLIVRMEELKKHYTKFEQAHTIYRLCVKLSSDVFYTSVTKMYLRLVAKIENRIQELSKEVQSRMQPQANSTMNNTDQHVVRVETNRRPQIGKFSGKSADWPGFRDVFLAEVDRKDYEPVMKLIYLREACVDKAARILGTWQLTAANYKLAWESMLHAFDDDYQVLHGILDDMYNVKPAEHESNDDLQEILNVLNNSRRQLHAMATPQVLEEQLFIHYATRRMAPSTQDAWEQYRNRERVVGLTGIEEMKQFLHYKTRMHTQQSNLDSKVQAEKRVRPPHNGAVRSTSSNQRGKPYDRNASTREAGKSDSYGFGPPTSCIMTGCDQVHYLGQCPVFRRLSFADRLEIVKENRLCRCCLMTGHMSAVCKKRGCSNCPDARFKHHYHLCSKTVKNEPPKKEWPKPVQTTQ